MRIAIDYTAAVNQQAGIGRFVRCLVAALANLDPDDQLLLVHAAPNAGAKPVYPTADNISWRALRLPERALNLMWHRLGIPVPVDWLTGAVDIFHSPDFVLPPIRRSRSILTVHDLAFLLFPECADSRLRDYLEHVVPLSARRADYVVADSENTRNDVICLLGVPPERISVVPGGVENRFKPVQDGEQIQALRRRLGLANAPFVLWLGVIEPRKNVRRLMEAFAMVKQRTDLPHELLLVGRRGWLSDDVFRYAERSSYRDVIHFAGFVDDEDLPTLYSAADVFVFPSLYEGFGLPVLEAMACGTPVVSSGAASLSEVAGDAAVLIDPLEVDHIADGIERVLTDDSVRADLRARGVAQAERFNWSRSAEKLMQVYHHVHTGDGFA